LTAAESHRRQVLVEAARALLPELRTAVLYRVNALLERELAAPEVDPAIYDELERILAGARRAHRPRTRRA
jgi:hypothetical protein